MPNRAEWLNKYFLIDELSGGSLYAKGRNENTKVVETVYGKFSTRETEEGDLIADFPDLGLITIYKNDGSLGFVGVELSSLLSKIPLESLDELANGGENILKILRVLAEEDREIYIGMFPDLGEGVINLESNEGTVSKIELRSGDLRNGFGTDIDYGGAKIFYYLIDVGDELRLSIGEWEDGRPVTAPLSISRTADVQGFLDSKDSHRFVDLAGEILIGA